MIACGSCHWFPLRVLPWLGIKVVPSLHCVLWKKYRPLGTVPRAWAGNVAKEYLTDVRERDPIYISEGLGHPGLVQRVMNRVLVDNAILGPWIHVGSRMQLLSAARSGDELTARAKVTGNYEKKGHRFVELDALVVANGRAPVAHCQHIAIYQPREQTVA